MTKHFYSHLIEIDSIHIALDDLGLKPEEKDQLLELAHSHIHHTIIDTVLSELPEEDKKTFLSRHTAQKHDEIWQLLREKTSGIEEKIMKAVSELKESLHKDIQEAKNKESEG